jgi:ABC-type glycerol-3-phosphate transport system substrate-binding protein
MKKLVYLVLTAAVLTGLVVSCAPPSATPAPPPTNTPMSTPATESGEPTSTSAPAQAEVTSEPVTLTFWHSYGGSRGEEMEALIAEFNETRPYITVESVYGGNLWTMRDKLLTAIAGEVGPDVSQIDQFWCAELADSGGLIKMGDLIAADPDVDPADFYDKVWETAIYNDEIWTMPFSFSNIVLYYNKALFQEAGLDPEDPPETWDELVEMGKQLTIDKDGDGIPDQWGLTFPLEANQGTVYYWLAFLWQNGGELFNEDFTKSMFNEQPGVEALQFWIDLVHTHQIVPLAPPEEGFTNGLIAMQCASTSSLSIYRQQLGYDLGTAFMPKKEKYATGVGGANLAIFTTTPDVDASWEFVKWMTSQGINLRWSQASGYLPLRPAVVESEEYQAYLAEEPLAQVILDQMPYGVVRPNIPAYAPGSREIGLAVEGAVFGHLDPKTVLDAAAEKVDALLQE